MQIDLSQRWISTDNNINLVFNFTDARAKFDTITGGYNVPNGTLVTTNEALLQTGDNVLYNETEIRQYHLLINGKNASRTNVRLIANRCDGPCPLPNITEFNNTNVTVEPKLCRWSDPRSWLSGHVPLDGESVEVTQDCYVFLFDVVESALVEIVYINTILLFEDLADRHLRAKYIFVRQGHIVIGNSTHPFRFNATITLSGEKENQEIAYRDTIEAGNKILINTNLTQMYGIPRSGSSRLRNVV